MEDEIEIKLLLQTLSKIWGSDDPAIFEEKLGQLVADHNTTLFRGMLPPVNVHVVPQSMLSGPFSSGANAAANYNPAYDDRFAYIFLGRSAILSKDRARLILAHELIHHWEQTVATDFDSTTYPSDIDTLIGRLFTDIQGERQWRAAHSKRFLAKAYRISVDSGLELFRLLSGKNSSVGGEASISVI